MKTNILKKVLCVLLTVVLIPVSAPEAIADAGVIVNNVNFMLSDKLMPTKFNGIDSNFESNAGMLIVDMTSSTILGGSSTSTAFYSPDVYKLGFLLLMLNKLDLEKEIIISDITFNANESLAGFKKGDVVSTSDLLLSYLYIKAEDARIILRDYLSMSESELTEAMNNQLKGKWIVQTKFDGRSNKSGQLTCAYDLYNIVDELLNFEWFRSNFGKSSVTIQYEDYNQNKLQLPFSDLRYSVVSKLIPEGYSFIGHFTGENSYGNSQIILLKNADGNNLISVIIGKSIGSNLNYISKKTLLTLDGEQYLTMEEEEAIGNEAVTPTLTQAPTETPIPTETPKPTETPVPTKVPKPTAPPTEVPKPTIAPTKAPVSSGGSPTSSYSSISIPKVNNNLTKYGSEELPIESEDARYQYLLGTNEVYYTFDNPPPGYLTEAQAATHMITITVPVWKMTGSGRKYASSYDITINKKLAANVKAIFEEIYELKVKFPIKVLKGYGYRKVGGVGLTKVRLMSIHSYGAAIDINPGDYDNDYFLGAGNDLRDKSNPYCIPDEVIEIFSKYGWNWGGNFSISADTMHFQYLGLDSLNYGKDNPFRVLKTGSGSNMKGEDIWSLQSRLKELGYRITVDGVYGKVTESVIIKFQKKYGLTANGIVDYKTWETVINLTHYLPYSF